MRTYEVISERGVQAPDTYRAGQRVPPGTYRQLEGRREVRLEQEGVLPATCDGHVAVYLRRPETWGERQKKANDALSA